jgi:hypothetical protein
VVAYTKTLPQRTDNALVAEEHLEHSVFTWDPVGARWIHERGPEMSTPPVPPDVHAIQTYFYDPDEKEWIPTVLAPRGRELAAQWEGAHKVPDLLAAPSAPTKKNGSAAKKGESAASKKSAIATANALAGPALKRSGPPVPLFAIVLVLLIVGGGAAAVVAGTQSAPNASAAPTGTPGPGVSGNPSSPVAVSGQPTATPVGATPAPTQPPAGTPVATRTAAPTAAPTAPPPVANSITMSDGSVVTYNGPSRVNIGERFAVTFTVRNANNTPGSGTFLVSFGNASTGGAKTSSGTLDGSGRLVLNMAGATLPGNYPFTVNYKGQQGQITILRVG